MPTCAAAIKIMTNQAAQIASLRIFVLELEARNEDNSPPAIEVVADRPEAVAVEEMENRFDTKFRVGDIVDYHSVIDEPPTSFDHEITHIRVIPSSDKPVAWLKGKAGCVTVDALSFTTRIGARKD